MFFEGHFDSPDRTERPHRSTISEPSPFGFVDNVDGGSGEVGDFWCNLLRLPSPRTMRHLHFHGACHSPCAVYVGWFGDPTITTKSI